MCWYPLAVPMMIMTLCQIPLCSGKGQGRHTCTDETRELVMTDRDVLISTYQRGIIPNRVMEQNRKTRGPRLK
jgi:hypothetical protein